VHLVFFITRNVKNNQIMLLKYCFFFLTTVRITNPLRGRYKISECHPTADCTCSYEESLNGLGFDTLTWNLRK